MSDLFVPEVDLTGKLSSTEVAVPDRVHQVGKAWLNKVMPMAVTEQVRDTDCWTARIKGLRKSLGTGDSEAAALKGIESMLETWATNRTLAGEPLPEVDRPREEASAEIKKVVRISRLTSLLLTRSREWGVTRKKLPPHALNDCLLRIDKAVTAAAAQFVSTI